MQSQTAPRSPRLLAEEKYKVARANLLVMIGFTMLNIILALTGSSYMMLFSATFPYVMAGAASVSESQIVLIVCLSLAVVALGLYFLCWIFSKRHYGWMIVALVLFSLDTLILAGVYLRAKDTSGILDVVFHIWVLVHLARGIKYGHQLKTLPEEPEQVPTPETPSAPVADTTPLRRADTEVKHRVLLETQAAGYRICYRRVKRVNELVINGYVYWEMEMLVETAHELGAVLGGHQIQAGFDSRNSYIQVDGATVAKKMRWY